MRSYPKERSSSTESKEPWIEMRTSPNETPVEEQSQTKPEDELETKASFKSLWAFTTRKDAPSLAAALAFSVFIALIKPTVAIFFGQIFGVMTDFGAGRINATETLHKISIWSIALTAVGAAVIICEAGELGFWIIFGERQAKTVRHRMFTAMLDKDMEWYDQREDGMGSFLIRIQT